MQSGNMKKVETRQIKINCSFKLGKTQCTESTRSGHVIRACKAPDFNNIMYLVQYLE